MPQAPLSDELAIEAAKLFREHGSKIAAARAAGVPENTMRRRIEAAARRGFLLDVPPAMPGYRISKVTTGPGGGQSVQQKPEYGDAFEMPAGHVVKGVSALLDPDGHEIVKWIKTREGRDDPATIIETIKSAFDDFVRCANPLPAPSAPSADLMTLIPCNDWHIRLLTWERETGENWDLKIAERVIGSHMDDAIERSPSAGLAVVLGGGDLMHADTNENRTERSGNVLDADGRQAKGIEVAQRLKVRMIDAALRRNDRVIVRILKGNHDEYSSVAIAYFLLAWYRHEPRVTVDVDQSLFWWYRFGSVLLGATHGHTVKLQEMAGIMAHRRAEDWGRTKCRYVHGFHIHHKTLRATEGDGVILESHQAPVPQDGYHHGAGYLSGRSFQTITYHRLYGETSRVRVAILDAASR